MNLVVILGRLVADPEVRYTQSGKVVCQFTLAVDDNYGENKTTSFVKIVVWGKIGEICGNSLTKGQRALVDGRLQIRSYEAKDGSGKRWVTEIIAGGVQFLDRKSTGHQNNAPEGSFESMGTETTPDMDQEIPF